MDSTFLTRYLYLLITVPLTVLAVLTATLGALTFLNYARRKAAAKLSQEATGSATHQFDGTPFPPASRGMCDACSKAFDWVYHLPEGRRLCPACFHAAEGYKHAPPPEPHNPETGCRKPETAHRNPETAPRRR